MMMIVVVVVVCNVKALPPSTLTFFSSTRERVKN